MKNKHRFFHSIFFKTLSILFIGGVFIIFLVTMVFHNREDSQQNESYKHLVQYAHYIQQDLGSPPDFNKAKELSTQFPIDIRYDSPTEQWSTNDVFSELDLSELDDWKDLEGMQFTWHRGKVFVLIDQSPETLLFASHRIRFWGVDSLVKLLVTLALIILVIYAAIRRVLKPIKVLSEGVEQISKGNLDYQITSKGKDELGRLARAFNTMTGRIREMIQSKEQLLLDVSHEFRSPLTRLKVALEFLPDNNTKTSIAEDVNDLEKMVTEILETARLGSTHGRLNLQEIDLIQILEEESQRFSHHSPGIQLGSMPKNCLLQLDEERIRSVISNLLGNAIKYGTPNHQPVLVNIQQREEFIAVDITDHGDGIPLEELPYIFEPFYRVDKVRTPNAGGYGLGLHLCKKIMESHQGKIEVQSSSKGTTFSILFSQP